MTAVVVLRVFTTGNVRENAEATTKFVVATPKVCSSFESGRRLFMT